MQLKDYLTIGLSVIAVTISVISFLLTFWQRKKEDRRAVRKSLTETIADLTAVSLEGAKLNRENPASMDDAIVSLRRIFNGQRRYLANHAEMLADEIPGLVTDIDYNALALAFDSIGDKAKARCYWEQCIKASPSDALRAQNLRGFARFLYFEGQFQAGRTKYQESLQVPLSDSDGMRRIQSDTYLMWAKTEYDFGFLEEARRIRDQALNAAQRIGNIRMRDEMIDYAANLFEAMNSQVDEAKTEHS